MDSRLGPVIRGQESKTVSFYACERLMAIAEAARLVSAGTSPMVSYTRRSYRGEIGACVTDRWFWGLHRAQTGRSGARGSQVTLALPTMDTGCRSLRIRVCPGLTQWITRNITWKLLAVVSATGPGRPQAVHTLFAVRRCVRPAPRCRRYYPQDIAMHSFENVASMERKKSNWALLEKVIKVSSGSSSSAGQ